MDVLVVLLALATAGWFWRRGRAADAAAARHLSSARKLEVQIARLESENESLLQRFQGLEKYRVVADAQAEAEAIRANVQAELAQAWQEFKDVKQAHDRERASRLAEAQRAVADANMQAGMVVAEARKRAQDIAGEAYEAMTRAKEYAATAEAMKGVIKGYGDAYLVPTYLLLDDLASDFGHVDAGACLKRARELTRAMVQANRAAVCDYTEVSRRETAVRFVVDAFNGKVDAILSRVKSDNHGKLEQEIRGAYSLVNHNGMAFRNARVTEDFLNARLEELRWGATVQALRDQEREEQRRIREQMREEERARREYERAMKEAAQEEGALKKAMERVQAQVAQANEAQRAAFEGKLRDLHAQLAQAEERGRRALSMAQQTKAGHVYVISNVGSFGERVFKIGMTRRLEPVDRVRELGDASVPFEFDIHAMIYSEDAPALERALHLHFLNAQVNKVNPRKEFFRLSLEEIKSHVEAQGIAAHWTMTALAHDYRETLNIELQIKSNPDAAHAWTQRQEQAEEAAIMEDDTIDA
jgi:hypothetical protein